MASVNWATRVIFVPQSDLTLVSGSVYDLDVNAFRLELRGHESSDAGQAFPPTHTHNTEVVLSGVTYARIVEIINGYTITFEDLQYAVNLVGANNNIADVTNVNQVSIRSQNSAGLIVGAGANPVDIANAVRTELALELARIDIAISTRESEFSAATRAATDVGFHSNTQTTLIGMPESLRTALLNIRIDNTAFDPVTGILTAARRRYFPDRVTALASTPGGVGQGEDATATIAATPGPTPGQYTTYVEVEE